MFARNSVLQSLSKATLEKVNSLWPEFSKQQEHCKLNQISVGICKNRLVVCMETVEARH